MITDALLQLSDAQAVTASAYSTNTIDLGSARDIGAGEELFAVFTVDQSFATATSVQFQIVISANANLSSHEVLVETPAIAIASLNAGRAPIALRLPRTLTNALGQRYLGARYTIGGSNATAGQVTCNIVKDVQDVGKHYPSGFTVL